jgi:hypothetical protein
MATFPSKVNYATGDILTATNMNDVGGAINLLDGAQYAGAKNRVLNSNMSVWQRGTSIATGAAFTYGADRWQSYRAALATGMTVSRQVTNDTTNLPFIQYCARVQRDSGNTGTGTLNFYQSFESVNSIPLAGKTVVLSFYARAGANFSSASNALSVALFTGTGTDQNVGSAGYTGNVNAISGTATLTTTWQRFTYSATLTATTTELSPLFQYTPVGTAGANDYFEITGVQLEAANTASPYAPNGATYQAELAACQRYYWRTSAESKAYNVYSTLGIASSTAAARFAIANPVAMRTAATAVDYSNISLWDSGAYFTITSLAFNAAIGNTQISYVESAGSTLLTIYRPYFLAANNSTAAYLGFSAEL